MDLVDRFDPDPSASKTTGRKSKISTTDSNRCCSAVPSPTPAVQRELVLSLATANDQHVHPHLDIRRQLSSPSQPLSHLAQIDHSHGYRYNHLNPLGRRSRADRDLGRIGQSRQTSALSLPPCRPGYEDPNAQDLSEWTTDPSQAFQTAYCLTLNLYDELAITIHLRLHARQLPYRKFPFSVPCYGVITSIRLQTD